MHLKNFKRLAGLVGAVALQAAIFAPAGHAAETAVGLVPGSPSSLVTFPVNSPNTATASTINFGAATDTDLIGIDYRPRGGGLYGAGSGGTFYFLAPPAMPGGAFTATQINPTPAMNPFTSGGAYGFDFNPAPDAIRVVNDANQNLRFSPNNGALLGTDTALNPGTPNIVAAAYSNNRDGVTATQTTLYDIDATADALFLQGGINGTPSPNLGALTAVGSLGVNTNGNVGFDISGGSDIAYASLTPAVPGTGSGLYTVNLTSGAATSIGAIGAGATVLEGMTVTPSSKVEFSAAASSVAESAGTATITVQRTGGLQRSVTVDYATSAGTASAADYSNVSGTLTFPVGVASQTFAVPVTGDTTDEPNETVNLALSNAGANAFLPSTATSSLTIVDDDDVVGKPGSAPLGLISAKSQNLKQTLKGVRGSFSCNEACRVTLVLKQGAKRLGSVTSSGTDSSIKSFKVNLTKAGKKALKAKPKKQLSLTGTFSDSDGSRTATVKFRVG